jgi:hypothetical protein
VGARFAEVLQSVAAITQLDGWQSVMASKA